jgi:hypothetical protein
MLNANGEEFVAAELLESVQALLAAQQSLAFRTQTLEIARAIVGSLKHGGKVLLAGNGGSAADAQHIAGELVSRMNYDRPAYAGLALSTDTSVLQRSAMIMVTSISSHGRSLASGDVATCSSDFRRLADLQISWRLSFSLGRPDW